MLRLAIPVSLWVHCVLIATNLINKLPTPMFRRLTGYEVLLGKKPYYSMLRVFVCFAFAVNPDRFRDKMAQRVANFSIFSLNNCLLLEMLPFFSMYFHINIKVLHNA